MAWDFFLDPQMVSAERWSWEITGRTVPFQPEIPLSNAFGWLLTGMGLMALLHYFLPSERRSLGSSRAVPEFFLAWTWVGGVIANLFYFDRPGVAFVGGLALGALVVSYFLSVRFGRRD
jgi:putative membrane protein